MAKKDTDLLNDPLNVAQTRYREQIDAFKNQYIPKPNTKLKIEALRKLDFPDNEIQALLKRNKKK